MPISKHERERSLHFRSYWNFNQPIRPIIEDGMQLNFRTKPVPGMKKINPTKPGSIAASFMLYRAARAGDIPQQTLVSDLYEWLLGECPAEFNKIHMGSAIVQSTIYNPRKLYNTKDLYGVTYIFHDIRDLIYGLEWQICIWLQQILEDKDLLPKGLTREERQKLFERELDFMANDPFNDSWAEYASAGLLKSNWRLPNWESLEGEDKPLVYEKPKKRVSPPMDVREKLRRDQ